MLCHYRPFFIIPITLIILITPITPITPGASSKKRGGVPVGTSPLSWAYSLRFQSYLMTTLVAFLP